jgi:Ca2+/Na+ antiporter
VIALIEPLELDAASRNLHLPVALGATLVFCATLRLRHGVSHLAGALFLGLYVGYVAAAIAAG